MSKTSSNFDKARVLAERALALNTETRKLVDNFEKSGRDVDNTEQLDQVEHNIKSILSKKRITQSDLARLREYGNKTQYDYLKVTMQIRGKEVDGVAVAEDTQVNLGDVRRSVARQVKAPGSLSDEQRQIISQYADAVAQKQNTQVADLSTPESRKAFGRAFNIVRDVAIGGNSTLINDLSYTYDALNEGRDFVELLQSIMSDKNNFVLIETWYRYTAEGKDTQYKIDQSVKKYWYEGFKDFSATIIEAINNMPNLTGKAEDALSDFQQVMEVKADEFL